jgi:hypothetical protein
MVRVVLEEKGRVDLVELRRHQGQGGQKTTSQAGTTSLGRVLKLVQLLIPKTPR